MVARRLPLLQPPVNIPSRKKNEAGMGADYIRKAKHSQNPSAHFPLPKRYHIATTTFKGVWKGRRIAALNTIGTAMGQIQDGVHKIWSVQSLRLGFSFQLNHLLPVT